jgi:hypothetical protein
MFYRLALFNIKSLLAFYISRLMALTKHGGKTANKWRNI